MPAVDKTVVVGDAFAVPFAAVESIAVEFVVAAAFVRPWFAPFDAHGPHVEEAAPSTVVVGPNAVENRLQFVAGTEPKSLLCAVAADSSVVAGVGSHHPASLGFSPHVAAVPRFHRRPCFLRSTRWNGFARHPLVRSLHHLQWILIFWKF